MFSSASFCAIFCGFLFFTVNETVGTRREKSFLLLIPAICTSGNICKPLISLSLRICSYSWIACIAACRFFLRPLNSLKLSWYSLPIDSPIHSRYSITPNVPACPSCDCVPVSYFPGGALSAGRTLYDSSFCNNSYLPHKTPWCGPKNLYGEQTRKSHPKFCTSAGPWGTYCTASTKTIVSDWCAISVIVLTSFTVPRQLLA